METNIKYPKAAGIYKLTCVHGGKIYIGKTVDLRRRLSYHKNCGKYATNGYLQRAIIKHGWDSFTVEILEIVDNFNKLLDNDGLLKREAYYIELFDSTNEIKGYNLCKSSTDRTGHKCSAETREKMRQAQLGKKLSEEHKEKMRQSRLGIPRSQEDREKISRGQTGKKFSEERKQKLRKPKSEETREKMRKPKSPEHRENIRQAKIRRDNLKRLNK